MISFSGEVIHVHYCFSSKNYSQDLHSSFEIITNHHLCKCNFADTEMSKKSGNISCCKNSGSGITEKSCCVEILASSNPDKQYNLQFFQPQFKAKTSLIFYSSTPLLYDSKYNIAFDFNNKHDHSPPETISTQILLI